MGGKGFNEIRFEDKKGEQLFVHGEKNADIRIKNDRREWVGNDRHLVVARDQVEKVEQDRHAEVIRDEVVKVGQDRHVTVIGMETVAVQGTHSFKVTGTVIEIFDGSCCELVSKENYVKGMNVVIEGMTALTLKVGKNFITINSGGVFISGTLINLNSGGSALEGTPGQMGSPSTPLAAAIAADSVAGEGHDPGRQADPQGDGGGRGRGREIVGRDRTGGRGWETRPRRAIPGGDPRRKGGRGNS